MSGSIFENMRMVNEEATETQINEALSTACIYDYVKTLPEGLEFKLGENGRGLSEGQNQRLSIARALLKNAPILLMDEATSALDVATERRIIDNIRKKASEKTIIITTHRPTVLSMCDRVYRIADKKITELTENDIQKLLDEF
jgi:ABC-type multidrug transport system fused ATPase/permease subunit